MSEVFSNLKPDPTECQCGCGLIGQPRAKTFSDGTNHVRLCRCRRCQGGRNRKGGLAKQNKARKALGVPGHKHGDANEERWSDNVFANEVKSGKQCGPLANWWLRVEKQVQANEASFGDMRRPVRAIAMPEGWSDGLVAVRLSTWQELVRPALEEFYGPEGAA